MRVYLIRHGQARDKAEDPDRHLTCRGEADAIKMAEFLSKRKTRVASVWHSEKVRARQTAELIAAGLTVTGAIAGREGMGPNDPVDETRAAVEASCCGGGDLALVGHMPFMSRLASALLVGDEEAVAIDFATVGTACLEREDENDPWQLVWLVSPALI